LLSHAGRFFDHAVAMTTRRNLATVAVAVALTLPGCGSDDEPRAAPTKSVAPPTSVPASATQGTPVTRTPELDAIGVIGHSGATGADSSGDGRDIPGNSWATGDNPEVESIYLRLLADHPALKGHNWNEAVNGTGVDSLMHQAQTLLAHDPVPDIVLVNSVDNDIQCDGTDEQNYDPFQAGIDEVLSFLESSAPGIKIFFVDQWTSVKAYDDVVAGDPGAVSYASGTGVCSTFTAPGGERNPEAEAYLQHQVDEYFARIVRACAQHTGCATDGGAMQAMPLEFKDITDDYNHLTVTGLAKEAAIAWDHLPPDWK
jgi:hypothetical protein